MKFMFWAALMAAADISFALPPVQNFNFTPPIHKASYVAAEQGLRELNGPARLMETAPKIDILDKDGKVLDTCTANIVSDHGHILTAGHCFEICLRKAGLISVQDGISVVDRARLKDAGCSLRIGQNIAPVEILATNDCRGEDRFKEGNAKVKCNGADFAMVKLDPSLMESRSCVQVARGPAPGPDAQVGALGYPPRTLREIKKSGAKDSRGDGQYLTTGKVIPFQPHCYMDIDGKKGGEQPKNWSFGNPQEVAAMKRQVEAGHLLQTTADVLRGVSGGGLADLNTYELVGIARGSVINNELAECVGSGFFTSTASILDYLKTEFPQVNLDQALDCRQNAFTPAPAPGQSKAPARVQPSNSAGGSATAR